MLKRIRMFLSFCFVFLACLSVVQAQRPSALRQHAPEVTASANAEQVRFAALPHVYQLRLQVFAAHGAQLFDSDFKSGNRLDWPLLDRQGQPLPDGAYLCLVTARDFAGRSSQQRGALTLQDGQIILLPPEQAVPAIRELDARLSGEHSESLILIPGGSVQVAALLLQDALRLAASGKNFNIGIGTTAPDEKLEVGGNIKLIGAGNGIIFPDGTKQTTAAAGGGSGGVTNVTASAPLASSGGAVPNISLTGVVPVANGGTGSATGDGSALNNLNASNLASGTVPAGRLSGTYSISISGNAATATTAGNVSGVVPVANGGTGVTALSNIVGTTNQVNVSAGTARVIGGNVTLSLPQDIATSSTPQFTRLGLGAAADANTALVTNGTNISTQADGTTSGVSVGTSFTKNDSNTRTFAVGKLKPTFNLGAGNANTTVNLLEIDSTNTALTGLTANLIKASFGGTQKFLVDSLGNTTVSGNLTVNGTLNATLSGDGSALTNLNASNITSGTLSNARLGVVPIANGGTGTSSGPTAAGQFLRSTGSGAWGIAPLSASDIPGGSGNYIQNQTGSAQTADFNISGSGTLGGTLTANIVNATTQYNINANRVLSVAGTDNLFAGVGAGGSNSGSSNTFVGGNAGGINTSGGNNSFFGFSAGSSNLVGGQNSVFGAFAGQSSSGSWNSFFGYAAGLSNTTESNNTFVGAYSDIQASTTNATAIGYRAKVTQSNSLVLGSIDGVNSASADTKVGIGTTAPKTKLHVQGDNIYVGTAGQGIILKSPDGNTCKLLTIDNSGALLLTTVTCP